MSKESLLEIYGELIKIRQLLELLARDSIIGSVEQVATTNERKKVWVLCTGSNSTTKISEKVAISQRAVQIFLKELQEADLITIERRGYPKRKFDYVPSGWESGLE